MILDFDPEVGCFYHRSIFWGGVEDLPCVVRDFDPVTVIFFRLFIIMKCLSCRSNVMNVLTFTAVNFSYANSMITVPVAMTYPSPSATGIVFTSFFF